MVPGIDSFYTSSPPSMYHSDGHSDHLSRSQHSVTGSPPSASIDNDYDDSSRNAKRTPKACDRCRHKKTKCTGDSPCQRCRLDNTVCSFTNRRPKEGPNFNPRVAQKDAAMSMLYKCIEVMNRQLLAARLGPYNDSSFAEYAESEEFIIGIILDRFGVSPVLDEFDNQPVYLPGQRGFNPDNCEVEFPQYSSFRDCYEGDNNSKGSSVFTTPGAPSSGSYQRDVQMAEREENNVGGFNETSTPPQRHHTYTYGQQSIARDQSSIWTHQNKLVDEPLLMQGIFPDELNSVDSTSFLAESTSASHQRQGIPQSVYQLQQAQIDLIRREQLAQQASHSQRQSPPLGQGYAGLHRGQIPLPPHIMQAAEMQPTSSPWEFSAPVSTAGPSTYPSALCSARASPEIAALRLSGRKTPSLRGVATPDSSIYTSAGGYSMEMSDSMGSAIRTMGW